jgi:multicomponent Na+:H+ antiporter subunit C
LPHVLMLTAIVVGVSTLGVGLAVTQKLYREFGSIEENEIIEKITSGQ